MLQGMLPGRLRGKEMNAGAGEGRGGCTLQLLPPSSPFVLETVTNGKRVQKCGRCAVVKGQCVAYDTYKNSPSLSLATVASARARAKLAAMPVAFTFTPLAGDGNVNMVLKVALASDF